MLVLVSFAAFSWASSTGECFGAGRVARAGDVFIPSLFTGGDLGITRSCISGVLPRVRRGWACIIESIYYLQNGFCSCISMPSSRHSEDLGGCGASGVKMGAMMATRITGFWPGMAYLMRF